MYKNRIKKTIPPRSGKFEELLTKKNVISFTLGHFLFFVTAPLDKKRAIVFASNINVNQGPA